MDEEMLRRMDENGVAVWQDERGRKVEIKSFFSEVFIDEGVERLSREYDIWQCDGEIRCSSLGKTEIEVLVAKILSLVRVVRDNNGISLVGVSKLELSMLAKRASEHWYIDGLVKDGFLREKWILGELVVFPTAKLLENQKIPKSKA